MDIAKTSDVRTLKRKRDEERQASQKKAKATYKTIVSATAPQADTSQRRQWPRELGGLVYLAHRAVWTLMLLAQFALFGMVHLRGAEKITVFDLPAFKFHVFVVVVASLFIFYSLSFRFILFHSSSSARLVCHFSMANNGLAE